MRMSNLPCLYCRRGKMAENLSLLSVSISYRFSAVYIRGVALISYQRNWLSIQYQPVLKKIASRTHWSVSSTFYCVIWLQSQDTLFEKCVCLGGALHCEVWSSENGWMWGDSWSDTSTHTYLHTQGSSGTICTVPGRANTQLTHAHSHTHTHPQTGPSGWHT